MVYLAVAVTDDAAGAARPLRRRRNRTWRYNAIARWPVSKRPDPVPCDKRIAVPHDPRRAVASLLLPLGNRILTAPRHQQLLLLTRHRQAVTVIHIEVNPRDQPLNVVPRLSHPLLKIHL